MRKLVLTVATVAALLVAAPDAGAVITSSNVTAPAASPTFLDPNTDIVNPLTVSGTASGTGNVDIRCVYNNGATALGPSAANVPVSAGSFSTTIDQSGLSYYICRLLAVPAGTPAPYNLANFQGPVVSFGGYYVHPVATTGANAGKIADYNQTESALEGYWQVYSAGDEVVGDSYPLDPSSLNYIDTLWNQTRLPMLGAASEPSLRLDGRNAALPYEVGDVPGFEGIQNLNHSIDTTAGDMRISDTEPLMFCQPDDATCSSVIDAGVHLDQSQIGGTRGHTLEVRQRFVNTAKTAKGLDVTYDVAVAGTTPGWRFPGQSSYAAHAANDTFAPAGPGPASFFVMETAGGTCTDLAAACGSLTWYQAPDQVKWDSASAVQLTYHRTIPANGSVVLAFTYSQGYPQAPVDGYAAAAEKGYATSFTIGKLKRNKKKGTATLALDVPAAGSVHVAGKNVKKADVQATGPGTVLAPIKATGKAKKKLKKRGKVKLKPSITYTNTGLDPTTQTAKVLLKRKRKRHH